ncbi:MAG: hypothetical protein ACNYWU_08410, partial [Desulfobacterales bacterium]
MNPKTKITCRYEARRNSGQVDCRVASNECPFRAICKLPALPVVMTCAWHGALTELPVVTGSHKMSAVTGRKGNAN